MTTTNRDMVFLVFFVLTMMAGGATLVYVKEDKFAIRVGLVAIALAILTLSLRM